MNRGKQTGFTLLETLVVVIMIGVLAAMGIPRYNRASEQVRVDQSAGVLRSISLAQRMYWLEYRRFAPDLETLVALKLLDDYAATTKDPFAFTVRSSGIDAFTALARRARDNGWRGDLVMDETAAINGWTQDRSGNRIAPSLQ